MGRRNSCKTISISIILIIMFVLYLQKTTEMKQSIEIENENGFPIGSRPKTFSSKAEEMNERTLRMRRVCSQYPKRRQLFRYIKGRLFYISKKYNLSYCRVAKVGSTFWTQAFLTMSGIRPKDVAKNVSSLFDIPRDEAHDAMKLHKELIMPLDDKRIEQTTSFLVARNPYSRLFSSYIDQIYLPNKWYLAPYISPDPSNKKLKCGKHISFDGFLKAITKFIIRKYTGIDLHWSPIFSICKPCSINIDILAKQETFNEDAKYILNLVGVDQATVDEIDKSLKEANAVTSLAGLVHTYVTKAHDTENVQKGCISEIDLADRLWSAFQIQGHIHNGVPFPRDQFSSSTVKETEKTLTKLVLEAVEQKPLSSEEKDSQRHQWKRHFWQQIQPETLEKVQDAFYEDFIVFDYDLNPDAM